MFVRGAMAPYYPPSRHAAHLCPPPERFPISCLNSRWLSRAGRSSASASACNRPARLTIFKRYGRTRRISNSETQMAGQPSQSKHFMVAARTAYIDDARSHPPSPGHSGATAQQLEKFGSKTPLGRAGQPAELASIYVQLAAADARFATGQVYGSS